MCCSCSCEVVVSTTRIHHHIHNIRFVSMKNRRVHKWCQRARSHSHTAHSTHGPKDRMGECVKHFWNETYPTSGRKIKTWNECAERSHAAPAAAAKAALAATAANFLYESKSSYSDTVGGLLSNKIGTYRRMTMLFATIYKSMAWKIYGIESHWTWKLLTHKHTNTHIHVVT